MTEAVPADPILETDFVKEMARQMRALDTYGTYQGWTVEKIRFALRADQGAQGGNPVGRRSRR